MPVSESAMDRLAELTENVAAIANRADRRAEVTRINQMNKVAEKLSRMGNVWLPVPFLFAMFGEMPDFSGSSENSDLIHKYEEEFVWHKTGTIFARNHDGIRRLPSEVYMFDVAATGRVAGPARKPIVASAVEYRVTTRDNGRSFLGEVVVPAFYAIDFKGIPDHDREIETARGEFVRAQFTRLDNKQTARLVEETEPVFGADVVMGAHGYTALSYQLHGLQALEDAAGAIRSRDDFVRDKRF